MPDAYDSLDRVSTSSQTTGGQTYSFGTWNLADQLLAVRYPSGRVVTQVRGLGGHVTGTTGFFGSTSKTYANGITYAAGGALRSASYGGGLAEYRDYNDRYQLTAGVNDAERKPDLGHSERVH